MTERFIKD